MRLHVKGGIEDQVVVRAGIRGEPRARRKLPSAFRAFYRLALRLRLKVWLPRYKLPRVERVGALTLVVLPGVFNGVVLRTGTLLANALTSHSVHQGTRVLDLGTGCGISALFAARLGANVIATDINPEAVRCTQINALVNHLERRIETRLGDLFEPVSEEKFDLVLFNPPFYRGRPRDPADAAWRSVDVFDRFLRDLHLHLTTGGRALLVLSTDADIREPFPMESHLTIGVVKQSDYVNEILTLYEITVAEDL
jgi:release factor glutamine methyltransferase